MYSTDALYLGALALGVPEAQASKQVPARVSKLETQASLIMFALPRNFL